MTATVSVVIPAYNAQQYLRETLESIRQQSVAPLEILVVNDGSIDETASIANSFEGVRCIHQENAGVSAARNRGIAESKGRFIAFLDADDVWREDKLARQIPTLQENTFAFSARTETDKSLQPTKVVQAKLAFPILEGLLFHGNVVGTPSSVVAPRAALLAADGFDPKLSMCADWDMWIRLALRLEGRYSSEPLLFYRVRDDSMSASLPTYESDSMYMLKKAFSLDLPTTFRERRSEAESRMSEVLAACYWGQGKHGDAFRCARAAIRKQPSRLASLAVSVPFRMLRRLSQPRR